MSCGFYIHIPFCEKKCAYCDFYSVTCLSLVPSYVAELKHEIIQLSHQYPNKTITTIYFGGGTPGLLSAIQIADILNTIKTNFDCVLQEVTLEVNPNSAAQPEDYLAAGVTRLSVGVQSVNDQTLASIGRLHSAQQALDLLRNAQRVGLRVSADLMIGLPYETEADLDRYFDQILPLVGHISAYMLKVEHGTPLAALVADGKTVVADDDRLAELYDYCAKKLNQMGFYRYEVSNFCRQNEQSCHNLLYWELDEYFGAGAGAHSFLDGKRFYNVANIDCYLNGEHGGSGKAQNEDDITSINDRMDEAVMLALRTAKGLDIQKFYQMFGVDFFKAFEKTLPFVKQYLLITDHSICICPQYLLLENQILTKLLQAL